MCMCGMGVRHVYEEVWRLWGRGRGMPGEMLEKWGGMKERDGVLDVRYRGCSMDFMGDGYMGEGVQVLLFFPPIICIPLFLPPPSFPPPHLLGTGFHQPVQAVLVSTSRSSLQVVFLFLL